MGFLDEFGNKSIQHALGNATVKDLADFALGTVGEWVSQIVDLVKGPKGLQAQIQPTLAKADAVLDEARGTLQRFNAFLDRVGGKA